MYSPHPPALSAAHPVTMSGMEIARIVTPSLTRICSSISNSIGADPQASSSALIGALPSSVSEISWNKAATAPSNGAHSLPNGGYLRSAALTLALLKELFGISRVLIGGRDWADDADQCSKRQQCSVDGLHEQMAPDWLDLPASNHGLTVGVPVLARMWMVVSQRTAAPSEKTVSRARRAGRPEENWSAQHGIVAHAVLPDVIEFRCGEESDPIKVEEFIRDALAEHQDVVGVDGHLHPSVSWRLAMISNSFCASSSCARSRSFSSALIESLTALKARFHRCWIMLRSNRRRDLLQDLPRLDWRRGVVTCHSSCMLTGRVCLCLPYDHDPAAEHPDFELHHGAGGLGGPVSPSIGSRWSFSQGRWCAVMLLTNPAVRSSALQSQMILPPPGARRQLQQERPWSVPILRTARGRAASSPRRGSPRQSRSRDDAGCGAWCRLRRQDHEYWG